MRLIDDWREAWRLWSVRLAALGSLLSALALALPDVVLAVWHVLPVQMLPRGLAAVVPFALFAATLIARLVQQRRKDDDDAD